MNEVVFDKEKYQSFIDENNGTGTLKVQAFVANQAFPLQGIDVKVFKNIGDDKVIFFEGETDSSGIIDDISLPAVVSKEDVEQASDIIYTIYNIEAINPETKEKKEYEIAVFSDLKIIQSIRFSNNYLMGEELWIME